MPLRRRVFLSLTANAAGQLVTIGSQIILTPLYFSAWGAAKYGEWLILSSIPAYLIMADLGIGSAAGNEMSMRAGSGDRTGVQQTFFGAFRVAGFVSLGVMMISCLVALSIWKLNVVPTLHISQENSAVIMMVLGLGVCLSFGSGVLSAGFRCCGQNALGIYLVNLARLLEAVLTGVFLLWGYSPLGICIFVFAIKAILTIGQTVALKTHCPWLFSPHVSPDHTLVRRLIKPSLGFLAFPMGNALALQGPILVLGVIFGGSAVAIFSAMRTLSRLPIQIMNAFNSSVWPEMSFAYGAGDMSLLRKLHRKSWRITVGLVMLAWIALAIFGSQITHLWLGSAVVYNNFLFQGLLLVAVFSALWGVSSTVLVAVNAHMRMGLIFVAVNAAGIGIMWLISTHFGMQSVVFPMFLVELILLVSVLPQALKISQDSLSAFFKSILWFG